MSVESFPVDHADYIDPKTLEAESGLSDSFTNAYVAERAHSVRADVISLLQKYNVLGSGICWAIFKPEVEPEFSGSVMHLSRKDILVYMTDKPHEAINARSEPHIRIISNEAFTMSDDGTDFLVNDFVLDKADDAQYLVGVFPNRPMPAGKGQGSVHVPAFWVEGGELKSTMDLSGFVRRVQVWGKHKGEDKSALPFGNYTNPWHRLDALYKAEELLAEVKPVIPARTSLDY